MDYHLARRLVRRYLQLAGFKGDFRVCTRRSTLERYLRQRGETTRIDLKTDVAISITDRPPVVWFNMPKHDLAELHDSAAHEAVHIVQPRREHGYEFDRAVRRLKRRA